MSSATNAYLCADFSQPHTDMTRILIAVFLGGGLGSLMRYGVQSFLHLHITPFTFPWATLGVNVAGSFLIGLFYALSARLGLSEETRLFLTTGLCGGFTTFSTFSHEGLGMLRQGSYLPFLAYVTASVALGVTAALCGGWTGNACLPKG